MEDAQAAAGNLRQLKEDHPAPVRCSWSDIHICAAVGDGLVALAADQTDTAVRTLTWAYQELLSTDDQHGALRVSDRPVARASPCGFPATGFNILKQILAWAAQANTTSFVLERYRDVSGLLASAQKEPAFASDRALRDVLDRLIRAGLGQEAASNDPAGTRASKPGLSDRERA